MFCQSPLNDIKLAKPAPGAISRVFLVPIDSLANGPAGIQVYEARYVEAVRLRRLV